MICINSEYCNLVDSLLEAKDQVGRINNKGAQYRLEKHFEDIREVLEIHKIVYSGSEDDFLQEFYKLGYERGLTIIHQKPSLENTNIQDLFEIEENSRQYSPFEHTANYINSLDYASGYDLWSFFDEGVRDVFEELLS